MNNVKGCHVKKELNRVPVVLEIDQEQRVGMKGDGVGAEVF